MISQRRRRAPLGRWHRRRLAQGITEVAARLVQKKSALNATTDALAAERAALAQTLQREQGDASTALGRACRIVSDETAKQDAPLAARASGLATKKGQLQPSAEQRRSRRESLAPLAEAGGLRAW